MSTTSAASADSRLTVQPATRPAASTLMRTASTRRSSSAASTSRSSPGSPSCASVTATHKRKLLTWVASTIMVQVSAVVPGPHQHRCVHCVVARTPVDNNVWLTALFRQCLYFWTSTGSTARRKSILGLLGRILWLLRDLRSAFERRDGTVAPLAVAVNSHHRLGVSINRLATRYLR